MELPKELAPSSTFSYGSLLPFQSKSCAGASEPIKNPPSFDRGYDAAQSSEAASSPFIKTFKSDLIARTELPYPRASYRFAEADNNVRRDLALRVKEEGPQRGNSLLIDAAD
jgi:hypothetical protein